MYWKVELTKSKGIFTKTISEYLPENEPIELIKFDKSAPTLKVRF